MGLVGVVVGLVDVVLVGVVVGGVVMWYAGVAGDEREVL